MASSKQAHFPTAVASDRYGASANLARSRHSGATAERRPYRIRPDAVWYLRRINLNSEVEQVVLLLVLENSRYLTVTLIERSSAGRFGPCFDAGSQQIEHDDEHEHDSLTSESGINGEVSGAFG